MNSSTHVKPLTSMVGDLDSPNPPDFVWVTPNMLDDMHDGPLATGDTWLSQQIPTIQASPWYREGGVILVLWDEGQDSDTSGLAGGDGGHVPGIVISQTSYGRAPDPTPVDDTGILRSIEQALRPHVPERGRRSSPWEPRRPVGAGIPWTEVADEGRPDARSRYRGETISG